MGVTNPMNAVVGTPINFIISSLGAGVIHATGGSFSGTSLTDPTQGASCNATNVMKQWTGTTGEKTISWTASSEGNYGVSVFTASGNMGTLKRKMLSVTVTNSTGTMSSTMETSSSGVAGSPTAAAPTTGIAVHCSPYLWGLMIVLVSGMLS